MATEKYASYLLTKAFRYTILILITNNPSRQMCY